MRLVVVWGFWCSFFLAGLITAGELIGFRPVETLEEHIFWFLATLTMIVTGGIEEIFKRLDKFDLNGNKIKGEEK